MDFAQEDSVRRRSHALWRQLADEPFGTVFTGKPPANGLDAALAGNGATSHTAIPYRTLIGPVRSDRAVAAIGRIHPAKP